MGAAASVAALEAATEAATQEDLAAFVASLPLDIRAKVEASRGSSCAGGADSAQAKQAPTSCDTYRVELDFVVEEVFRCYDADQDGLIEREEYLACYEKIYDIIDESFGPKQRKLKMQWYKNAGAEGTPTEGMYLSKDKWREAFLKTACEDSGIPSDQTGKLAQWIWDSYAERLVEAFFPTAKPTAATGMAPDLAGGPTREYPVQIPLTDLDKELELAKFLGRRALILCQKPEAETFIGYKIRNELTLDSVNVFLKKKYELRSMLRTAMDYHGMCASIHLKMGDGAYNWVNFCSDDFPADIFKSTQWTPQVACEQDFISDGMKAKMDVDPEKWKEFTIVITSRLGLEEATAKLTDKIPFYRDLAIIVVDPESIADG